ncbi:carboxypeptidase-like protein [Flavobacterium cheniae]|uniref:Carboxypeptidase-like protein n=2 Tax=Flavobacterium cheniae TaxID=295428 RepID=A0A562KFH9_9FLAO|nr:carboxypeptidase-like protein [Flavobacterium cheniae]TWH94122.1 carboxypeptidase-like protein [Flavobacterium cheniae]
MKFFFPMKTKIVLFFLFLSSIVIGQTKVGGKVTDEFGDPVAFANVIFKNSKEGVITDENGNFYFESKENYSTLVVSYVGFEKKEISLKPGLNSGLKIELKSGTELKEVVIYTGKTSKKNNPAIDILRKIWERRRKNGLKMFKQYEYDKYEKVEFDLNTIDSAFMNSKVFKGMEFVFDQIDTSSISGKTYLPIFINETLSEVYGDNEAKKTKEITKANKNSGFGSGDGVNTFIKDLYADFDIYDNYLKFFDKDFVSPLSRTGINVYNYVLNDSMYIDNKWCYNIVYYPRRKNELTFKGDFWVNDTTFAIKKINLEASKSANINWVKEIYIEQEYEVLNDSVFLLTRDYMMSDFSFSKKEESKGVYGKRTTLAKNHKFNVKKDDKFYKQEVNFYDNAVFNKPDEYWEANRFEALNKNEAGIYKMLDTLKEVPRFKRIYSLASILGSGYIEIPKWKMDYGPIFSTFGYNDVEGQRLRAGGRTYFGSNDKWRIQGYTAYGFRDNQFKYGISGRWMVNPNKRLILSIGNRRDVEQMGVSLTTSNDVLGRSFASSALFASGVNNQLTSVNLTTLGFEIEPAKNFTFQTNLTYRTLKSASSEFSLDYYTDLTQTEIKSEVKQSEINFVAEYTPKRKTVGYGVDRMDVDFNYARVFLSYSNGLKGVLNSDFNYQKLQLYYRQPAMIGGFGRLFTTFETGKIFGEVPLGLMGVIPGNQSWFVIENTYNLLDYYDFVADEYASLHFEHHFNGRLFSRVPLLRKLNLREIIGIKGVYGRVSDENVMLNASGLTYIAPEDIYWEYHAGVGNIFKVLRVDFAWRGSYLEMPDARKFAVRASFGFYF